MSADLVLGGFVLQKYNQLTVILDDLIRACELGDCAEQHSILANIKDQTNHTGIHMTEDELYHLFLGRGVAEKGEVVDV